MLGGFADVVPDSFRIGGNPGLAEPLDHTLREMRNNIGPSDHHAAAGQIEYRAKLHQKARDDRPEDRVVRRSAHAEAMLERPVRHGDLAKRSAFVKAQAPRPMALTHDNRREMHPDMHGGKIEELFIAKGGDVKFEAHRTFDRLT